MSLLGDIARTVTDKPVVNWDRLTPNERGQIHDAGDWSLYEVLTDPCTFLNENGAKALSAARSAARQEFAIAQQRAHGGAWKRPRRA